jgi:hypothetical protein
MSINAARPFSGNVTRKPAIVLGVGHGSQSEDGFRRVGDEKLLTGNAQTLAPMASVDFGGVSVEPSPILFEALVLEASLGQLLRIGYFYHFRGINSAHGVILSNRNRP